MSEILARLTQTLCIGLNSGSACCAACPGLEQKAKDILKAIREPTKEMVAAGHNGSKCSMENMANSGGVPTYIVPWVWQSMIDEALK